MNTPSPQNIRRLSKEELSAIFAEKGEKSFRANQVYEWLWQKNAQSFSEMTNLSKDLREMLESEFGLGHLQVSDKQISNDRTIKMAFKTYDNHIIEGVLIPADERMTACISSQVGCSLTCKFCATGKLKRLRNLYADEIYDQVALIKSTAIAEYGTPLSNIVLMGMGEPLLNYAEVLKGINLICSPGGMNMSPSRITLSTAGIAKMINKLGDDRVKFNLALSLHAANETKRNEIMPINEQNSLDSLIDALNYFYDKTGNKITLEYIIFDSFNDEIADAMELVSFCKKVVCKVNIIEYNPIDGENFKQAKSDKVDAFVRVLRNNGIIVNVRRSRGKDIDAACGQLANKNKEAKPVFK